MDDIHSERLQHVTKELNMTAQEQSLYKLHLDNLYGPGGVTHDDGSRSSVYQAVQEHEGQYYNIPTVWNGKIETEPYTKPDGSVMDVPNATTLEQIAKIGWDRFPSYSTPQAADQRYDEMHRYMEEDTQSYFTGQ